MAKKNLKTIVSMPDSVKTLYVKILGVQALADKEYKPQEVSDLYLLMTQLDLNASARREVREFLDIGNKDLPALLDEIVSKVQGEDRDIVAFSVVKDLIRVAMVDGAYSDEEKSVVKDTAKRYYGLEAEEKIKLAEEVAKGDDDFIRGKFSTVDQLVEHGKKVAAGATAVGVPIAAVYFTGTVGLSCVGITSGLGALGMGGIAALGLNPMTAGIGVVVLMGVGTYAGVHYGLSLTDREKEKKRESLIQEIVKLHQRAIAALAEDVNEMATRQEKLAGQSDANRSLLDKLKSEMGILKFAIDDLKVREKALC